jgi:hypothetical protein
MDKMKLEMTITGKNRNQIIKRLLTMGKYLIDDMGEYDAQSVKYNLKKVL